MMEKIHSWIMWPGRQWSGLGRGSASHQRRRTRQEWSYRRSSGPLSKDYTNCLWGPWAMQGSIPAGRRGQTSNELRTRRRKSKSSTQNPGSGERGALKPSANGCPSLWTWPPAYPEVIHDPIHWAKDSVWERVEGICGIQRPHEGELLPRDWVPNDITVWWFAVASEGNPEVNLPPLLPWSARRWLACDRRETEELLERHAGYLCIRVNRVIKDVIAEAEIRRATNRKVEEHKGDPQSAKHTAYQSTSATAPSEKDLWMDQPPPRDKTGRSPTPVSFSEFEATVGKLMVEARTMCRAKYLPRAEILRIADLLDDKSFPVRQNLEREAARTMAEYNQRHPMAAIKSWRVAIGHPQFRRAVRKRFSRAEEKYKKATSSIVASSAGTPRTTI